MVQMRGTNLFILVLWSICGCKGQLDTRIRKFPPEFMFGVASSAYQVEGAWNKDGKGESIWDRFLHNNPTLVVDGVNGDVAADSYHQYQRDVEMCRELGVNFYRFSISWPRILPTGLPDDINEMGLQYYDNLIDELLSYNIQPMITLYHFDLPQSLQELGGWTNSKSVTWFEDYANIVFNRYASKVKYWITVNQPDTICMDGYGSGAFAPGIAGSGIQDYVCVKNVMLAHATAYRLYQQNYKHYRGMVGISIAVNWADPKPDTNNETSFAATELYRDFTFGLYLNPIWSEEGDFPSSVKRAVRQKCMEQGLGVSRLPTLTPQEIALLKGSADFLGMNHYTTVYVQQSTQQFQEPSLADDMGTDISYGDLWLPSRSAWLRSVPYGLYKALLYLNKKYDYPTIIITENGWSTDPGLKDGSRVEHMRGYLQALQLAIEDGSQVLGYTAWSLMDNVEWTAGVSERFGLYEVDFSSVNRTRTARWSALVYRHVIQTRVATDGWTPKNFDISVADKNGRDELAVEDKFSLKKAIRNGAWTLALTTSLWSLAAVATLRLI